MGRRRGLIDANVLIAAFADDHHHHDFSLDFLERAGRGNLATSTHCLGEFYSSATRPRSQGGNNWTPALAIHTLERFAADIEILTLSIEQHLEALKGFAKEDGIGPNVYDYLIGRVAVVHAIPLIVTWNVKHFAPLFPTLRIATPQELLQES